VVEKEADVHRVFEMKLKDIWNLGQASQKYNDFRIKIVSPGISYTLAFSTSEIEATRFKKEAKELTLK